MESFEFKPVKFTTPRPPKGLQRELVAYVLFDALRQDIHDMAKEADGDAVLLAKKFAEQGSRYIALYTEVCTGMNGPKISKTHLDWLNAQFARLVDSLEVELK